MWAEDWVLSMVVGINALSFDPDESWPSARRFVSIEVTAPPVPGTLAGSSPRAARTFGLTPKFPRYSWKPVGGGRELHGPYTFVEVKSGAQCLLFIK